MGWLLAFVAALSSPLCVDGHPAHRAAHITYGGLAPRPGWIRDHRWPLCGGGSDTAGNVWYEEPAESHQKDILEWRMCEAMCRGMATESDIRDYFNSGAWRQDLGNGYGERPHEDER